MELPLIVVVFAGFTLVVSLIIVEHQRRVAAWKSVADELRLTWDGDQVAGSMREVEVRVFIEVRGTGKQGRKYTIITADLDPNVVPLGLEMVREGLLSKVGKLLGGEDVQVGVPEVDDAFIIRGADPEEVRRWAERPDVSRGLVDIAGLCRDVCIQSHQVDLAFRGALTDRRKLADTLEALVDAARALSGKGYGALVYDESW